MMTLKEHNERQHDRAMKRYLYLLQLSESMSVGEIAGMLRLSRQRVHLMLQKAALHLAQNPPTALSPGRGNDVLPQDVGQTSGDGDGGSSGAN